MAQKFLQPGDEINGIKLEKPLGKGSFASVFETTLEDGKKYAVKCLDKLEVESSDHTKTLFETEVTIMKTLKHPNLLHLYHRVDTDDLIALVLHLCKDGTLQKKLKNAPNKKFEEKMAVFYLKQIIAGFQEMHKHKIMHRDFKLENVFLDGDTVVIGDFGLAKSGFQSTSTFLGTRATMAPEMINKGEENDMEGKYTSKIDIWAIGCTFYQMLFGGKTPFYETSPFEMLNRMEKESGDNMTFPDDSISEESKSFLKGVLQFDPERRFGWDEVFSHPLFTKRWTETADENNGQTGQLVDQTFEHLKNNHIKESNFQNPAKLLENIPAGQKMGNVFPQGNVNEVIKQDGQNTYMEWIQNLMQQQQPGMFGQGMPPNIPNMGTPPNIPNLPSPHHHMNMSTPGQGNQSPFGNPGMMNISSPGMMNMSGHGYSGPNPYPNQMPPSQGFGGGFNQGGPNAFTMGGFGGPNQGPPPPNAFEGGGGGFPPNQRFRGNTFGGPGAFPNQGPPPPNPYGGGGGFPPNQRFRGNTFGGPGNFNYQG